MGCPSGSKNCTVFTDALDLREQRSFDGSVIDDDHLRSDGHSNQPQKYLEEKLQKIRELKEFRSAKVDQHPVKKLVSKAAVGPSGPAQAPTKRLPGFVKLKSKDGVEAGDGSPASEPPEKRARVEGDASPGDGAAAVANVSFMPSPMASPLCTGLANYASDSEEEE